MWETSLNSTKHPRPLPIWKKSADVKATAAGQQSLPTNPSAPFGPPDPWLSSRIHPLSAKTFPQPARSEAQPRGARPPTPLDAFLEMQLEKFPKTSGGGKKGVNSSPSKEGTTVFLRASTSPRGEPNRKKSVTSKSNFPREPPSSMVLLLERLEPASPWSTLEWRLSAEGGKKNKTTMIKLQL